MIGRAVASLLALVALGSQPALACKLPSDVDAPTPMALAESSALVFIARVKGIASTDQDQAETPVPGVPGDAQFFAPVGSRAVFADFSPLLNLKGKLPPTALLRDAADSCGLQLQAGADYLIFADLPAIADNSILPLRGSFKLDGQSGTRARLSQIQAHLSPQTP